MVRDSLVLCLYSSLFFCEIVVFVAGIQPDPNAERRWVSDRIVSRSGSSNLHACIFWSDKSRGFVLATLQARVQQVRSFIDSCRDSLSSVYRSMYPLDVQPEDLAALLRKFRRVEDAKVCVRKQLVGGA